MDEPQPSPAPPRPLRAAPAGGGPLPPCDRLRRPGLGDGRGTGPQLPAGAAPGPNPAGAPCAPELAACVLLTFCCPSSCGKARAGAPRARREPRERGGLAAALRRRQIARLPDISAGLSHTYLPLSLVLSSPVSAKRGNRDAVLTPFSPFLSAPQHPVNLGQSCAKFCLMCSPPIFLPLV